MATLDKLVTNLRQVQKDFPVNDPYRQEMFEDAVLEILDAAIQLNTKARECNESMEKIIGEAQHDS